MKAKINKENIKGFIQGWSRFLGSKLANEFESLKSILEPESHIEEQACWRIEQVYNKSPECLGEKGCIHCGCMFPEKAFEDRGCSNTESPCYPPMMNKEEWKNFKK